MNAGEQIPTDGSESMDRLVAYLDGELDPDECRDVERRLGEDAEFRLRLKQLQQSWDLLNELPTASVDDSFTQNTLATVAVKVARDVQTQRQGSERRHRRWWWIGTLAASLAFLVGFVVARYRDRREEQRLVQDLPVIEAMDQYRYAESVQFLRLLDGEGLFAEEEIADES